MCGISGIVDFKKVLKENQIKDILNKFNKTLYHRGPDSKDTWINGNIGLAHTRLSIIDLSKNGSQPMVSNNKQSVISFNGEIYNFRELKKKIPNIKFNSYTDTEVILEYFNHYGIDQTIEKMNGMYAFSIYDQKNNELILARDRVGKKPIYYYHDENFFIWGSEINIFKDSPILQKLKIDRNAVWNYFHVGYIPGPLSIFEKVKKIKPGEIIKLSLKKNSITKSRKFFINKTNFLINNSFEDTLKDAVKIRTISDVPYGVFLSSGIDSTLVASILKDLNKNVDSFSIGIKDNHLLDESSASKKIAKHLGLNHHELIIDEESLINYFPKINRTYGEPFSDSSQIPTLILSEFSKKKITVALSGDGGDEIFCGYNRYLYLKKYEKLFNLIFFFNKFKISKRLLETIIQNKFFQNSEIKVLNKVKSIIDSGSFDDIYSKLVKIQSSKIDIFNQNNNNFSELFLKNENIFNENYLFQLQNKDVENYLPDDILTKVDRASMQSSLEVRCPLLDYRLSYALFLKDKSKIKNGESKVILRNILNKYIDSDLISKGKKGFGIPIKKWLKEGLFEITNDFINSKTLKEDEILNHNKIKKIWELHNSGKIDSSNLIWSTLIYLQWKNEWFKN